MKAVSIEGYLDQAKLEGDVVQAFPHGFITTKIFPASF